MAKKGKLRNRTLRGKDLKLLYTLDNNVDIRIRMRTTVDRYGNNITPVTPLLLTRVITDVCPAALPICPRKIKSCFSVASNKAGEGIYETYIPFHPLDFNHINQIKEIQAFVSVSDLLDPKYPLALEYYGETTDPDFCK